MIFRDVEGALFLLPCKSMTQEYCSHPQDGPRTKNKPWLKRPRCEAVGEGSVRTWRAEGRETGDRRRSTVGRQRARGKAERRRGMSAGQETCLDALTEETEEGESQREDVSIAYTDYKSELNV